MPAFEVIKERLEWNTCADEYWCATKYLWISVYDRCRAVHQRHDSQVSSSPPTTAVFAEDSFESREQVMEATDGLDVSMGPVGYDKVRSATAKCALDEAIIARGDACWMFRTRLSD